MSNAFDFELKANDQATAAISRIKEAVDSLVEPALKAKNSLQFDSDVEGGLDDIAGKLKSMATWAKDNVEYIGNMVPPLKMVGGLTLGLAGIAGSAYAIGTGLNNASLSAHKLAVNAKDAGMLVSDFQQLSGALQILGIDAESADESVGGLYSTFNEALQGRDSAKMSLLGALGVDVEKQADGTADVIKTLENLAKVFSTLSPQNQKTVADRLGLNANVLELLREGDRYTKLLSRSQELGFVVPAETVARLDQTNSRLRELGATWDGLKNRASQGFYDLLLSDGSIDGAIEGLSGLMEYGPDNVALMGLLGFHQGGDAEKLRRMYNDDEFRSTLDWGSDIAVFWGNMTSDLRKKYSEYYGEPNSLNHDEPKTTTPILSDSYISDRAGASRGIRNNNPLNIERAPNATGRDSRFAKFATAEDGISAAARQIMLHFERGNDSISSLVTKWAPPFENDTPGYINYVSKQTGFDPFEKLDMSNPEIMKGLIQAMTKQENGGAMPYSEAELTTGINNGLYDPRWHGLRMNPVTKSNDEAGVNSGIDTSAIAEALKEALSDNKLQLEITLIDQKSGQRKNIPIDRNETGKISLSMPILS